MIARLCTVPNCGSPAASDFSPHCRRHKSALRRHGAPDQIGVTKTELAPYLARIEARIAKNPTNETWPLMEEIWAALRAAELFVSIGTSGNVYPAAGFVADARHAGVETLELNLEPSMGTRFFDAARHGPATQVVPDWVAAMLA